MPSTGTAAGPASSPRRSMSEKPLTVCEACRQPLDPDEPGVIHAVELVPTRGFGTGAEEQEGMRVLFHETCFDTSDPRYRRKADAG
jgi:hypothetical protein